MKFRRYKFRKYKKNYPKVFEEERDKIIRILHPAKIEHIGSTAVPELGGKGVIDILICVPKKNFRPDKKKLEHAGYIPGRTGGSKDRISFSKEYGFFKKRRVHLHLTPIKSKVHKESIKFRDSLRKNQKLREEYSSIKQKAVSLHKKGQDYRDFKDGFIKRVLK